MKTIGKLACALAAFLGSYVVAIPGPGFAQNAAGMSCDQLWYARNAIYARRGYCFNTDRARAVFGNGCFPPYGQLNGWERSRVNELQMWERRKGC